MRDALHQYHEITGTDVDNPDDPFVRAFELCSIGDLNAILDVLDNAVRLLAEKRRGSRTSRKIREVLEPIVYGLGVLLDSGAETASSLVRKAYASDILIYLSYDGLFRAFREGKAFLLL